MLRTYKQCKGCTFHLVKIPPKYKKEVGKTTEKALLGAPKLFAYHKSVEIVIFSSIPEFVISEVGIGANATLQGDVVVNLDFSRRDIKKVIQKELSPVLYHEFSHVVRASIYKNLYTTLDESLVTEGIASYIEKKLFRKKVPYIKPIKNERKYWLQAKKNMRKKDYDHSEWFFGRGKLPRWIGYRLGYLIVSSFMKKNPKVSFAELTRIKSKDIFKDSSLT